MSAQWYHLGLQLKVRTGTLDKIRTQFTDPRDQLLEMLKTWLTTSDNTSWKTLTHALRSRSVEATQLASVLETKYCNPVSTHLLPPPPSEADSLSATLPVYSQLPHITSAPTPSRSIPPTLVPVRHTTLPSDAVQSVAAPQYPVQPEVAAGTYVLQCSSYVGFSLVWWGLPYIGASLKLRINFQWHVVHS